MRNKGFTLIELLTVVAIIGILASVIIAGLAASKQKARNASIVLTLSGLQSVVDLSKYPSSLEDLCLDFEPGGEFAAIRTGVEESGGIWNCDSTLNEYRVFVKLNQSVIVAENSFAKTAFAQEDSDIHGFGNYYCLNSDFDKNFTHWSGLNLTYPSCNDSDYTATIQDPSENPDPTPDPDPETDPDPPLENGGPACDGSKVEVCHFDKTLCVSPNALNAHAKHGDIAGACS